MSSIESIISEIESEYHRLLEIFEGFLTSEPITKFEKLTERELNGLLRDSMGFQRKIEYFTDTAKNLFKDDKKSERLKMISGRIVNRLSTTEHFEYVRFLLQKEYANRVSVSVIGIIPQLKKATVEFLHNQETEYMRNCYCAYFGLKSIRIDLIELEEELRLIGALTTYPIAKKITLKNQLVLNGFEEVAISLEEAESNTETEHFKDCVSRCRDAIEFLIASIKEKETDVKTGRHFATDLAKIVKLEIFDLANQRLAQGIYSFLSLKGSHKYDSKKVTVYDAETALKETYSLLEMLLKKYLDFKKNQK